MHYLFQPYNYDLSDPGSIPNLFLQHLSLVSITMFLSLFIALPLGLLVARHRRLYLPIITISGLLYTVPSIAAFMLLLPITKLSSATAIIPMVLYNQLVLIRNTVAAVNSIDPLLIEVGRAVGMNPLQILWRVRLPLALPVIIAGVRVATVTTIGIAGLAALVGQGGLGTLIFQNIATFDLDAILAGAILIALFALFADALLLGLQTLLSRGRSAVMTA
jgi:osmoprotectant transport system permease protein